MKKYAHNAVSVDGPEHFRGDFSVVFEKRAMRLGKKIIRNEHLQEIVPRRHCSSLPPMNTDQDLDMIKFSVKDDVFKGLKDRIRYKSKFHQLYFDGFDKGFSKAPNDITFMQPVHKITREETKAINNLQYQKSFAKILGNLHDSKEIEDIDPGNKLLKKYESEISTCKSPATTRINFMKKPQPDLSMAASKINCILISADIKEFEKKLPEPMRKRGNLWYKNLLQNFK